MMIITANDVNYFVEITGEGPPVLFLHGFTGDSTTWEELTSKLRPNFKCISVDIIGHGKSDAPIDPERYAIEKVAEDLECILHELDVHSVSILGYSMGGRLALTFTILFPDYIDKLILESSTPGLRTETERIERREKDKVLSEMIVNEGLHSFVEYWESIPLFSSQKRLPLSVQKSIRGQRLKQKPEGLSASLAGMGTGEQPSWWEEFKQLDISIHVLVGEEDTKFVSIANEMKKVNDKVKISTFPHVGHAIHVEEPRKFGTMVEEILKNL
jgi:2-succinyl-6-hydroxy-2,4-cyclohexadiene-1-carboxylate synthase